MTTYSPIIFHSIITRERERVRLQESFDLDKNMQRIKKTGKTNGGKSG
jgi:hypothetical protein